MQKKENKNFLKWIKGEAFGLSRSFSTKEIDCRCREDSCKESIISAELIDKLQTLRDEVGPIIVTSGYRCHTHNLKSGGVKNSTHRRGLAVDVKGFKTDKEKELWLAKAKELFDGVGEYKNFIHLDVRGYKSHFKGKN